MPLLSNIPGLLTAASPLQWALESLTMIGQGHHAWVFEHPVEPSVVVRISDYPDGWFEYVSVAEPGPHVPACHDLAIAGNCFLATAERLEPVPDDVAGQELIDCAIAVIRGCDASRLPVGAMGRFRRTQPDFETFVERLPFRPSDLREDNFMMKHGSLVLNDPLGSMSYAMEGRLRRIAMASASTQADAPSI